MSLNPRPTRSEQRDQARAKARELREQRAKGDKRKRAITVAGVTLAIVGVVAGVSFAIFSFTSSSSNPTINAKKVPDNVTKLGGVTLGKNLLPATPDQVKSATRIVIYQDYQCPICKLFEDPNSSQIRTWVQKGLATIEYHPISFLDGHSLNNYSSRAANATLCVANSQPEKFFDVNTVLYAAQPEENTAGPSDSAIKDSLRAAGVQVNDEINNCIDQKRYAKFIELRTSEAFSQPAVTGTAVPTGTPYILVNGKVYDWGGVYADLINPGRFAQFFAANQTK
jgi:protein-disulfide isomerase